MRPGSRDGRAVIGLLLTGAFLAGCGGPVRRVGTNAEREGAAAAAPAPQPAPPPQAGGRIDAAPDTWQRVSVAVTAPEGARYLLLHCLTEYRPDEDADVATRCGQYVDDIDIAVSAAAPAVVTVADHRKEVRQ